MEHNPSSKTDKEKTTPLIIDKAQIERFVSAMFFYADPGTYASLRSFHDNQNGRFEIKSVLLNYKPTVLITEAAEMAQRCASSESAIVFCPPIATFTNPEKADEASLANGLALSVECDQNPLLARGILEELLGTASIIVLSGGIWLNPETGELEDKIHLHWRLNEPTRIPEDHKRLKEARALATMLVGGDSSNKPVVHPIRWPGSWHRKKSPRLAHIISETDNDIDLSDAIEKLSAAVTAAGLDKATKSKKSGTTGKAKADDYSSGEARDTAALVAEITSGRDYHAPLTALAMRYLKGGMKTPQVVVTLRGFMEAVPLSLRDIKDGTMHPGRWQSRYNDIPRIVNDGQAKIDAEAKEWPEPKPIKTELLPVKPFDADALLPDALKTWVLDSACRMPCPPDYIAATAIVALGSIIGARCVIKPKSNDDWSVVPNLWGGIVGLPSAKKTPAMNIALKPLDRLIARATQCFADDESSHNTEMRKYEARKKALDTQLNKAAKQECEPQGKNEENHV